MLDANGVLGSIVGCIAAVFVQSQGSVTNQTATIDSVSGAIRRASLSDVLAGDRGLVEACEYPRVGRGGGAIVCFKIEELVECSVIQVVA